MNVNTELAVETVGVVKSFGATKAVDGLDLAVPAGAVYGVLGPNGAGKTTTLRILATLLAPDAGSARVFGHDVVRDANRVRERISLTGQFASVDNDLTGVENLVLLARLHGYRPAAARERARDLLEAFDLVEAAERPARGYSGGMRRRLDVAAGLIVRPQLMFLDEPTTGLDPRSRNEVWDIIRATVERGTTVLLTTQYLEEADQLAQRVAVIDHGKLVAEGTPGELKASVGRGSLRIELRDPADVPEASRILVGALGAPAENTGRAELTVRGTDPRSVARALGELTQTVEVDDFSMDRPSLDEVFLALTGRPATSEVPPARKPGRKQGGRDAGPGRRDTRADRSKSRADTAATTTEETR
ncbi:daunorubicin resistance protein DrrA family ABC transporter ATP-binding protein [Streptomyces atratus]|nr:ATP-binding cassette domain-containing protein [Streptomyces atratus]GGT56806.1 daunorubicin resistance protein DrrA family ABC transporter ATP-binding protein [Streptomyces atratus]